ncbi:MAG: aspartate kinase [Cyclobacteriaceae bacterium]|nr:aspartate kinase [Cyclobacteriaceae bacterium]
MKVLKFGGTSVGSAERMQLVSEIITATSEPKIIVLSAVSGTTNKLVAIGDLLLSKKPIEASELIEKLYSEYQAFIAGLLSTAKQIELAKKVVENSFVLMRNYLNYPFGQSKNNELVAQGEILSTNLFSLFLEENGIKSKLVLALDYLHLCSNGEPVLKDMSVKLNAILSENSDYKLFITQGFICLNNEGDIDNLKRGGSDYSASLIGAALKVDEIQIWTDIDGMHNNDPRIVETTKAIKHLSFDEAAELAYFGAKILHPATILPAQEASVPVRLKNTMAPKAEGTLIDKNIENRHVKAVAAKDGITAIKIKSSRMLLAHGFLLKIFQIFDSYKTSIDLVTTSEIAVSITIDNTTHLKELVKELEQLGAVEVDGNQSIICLVGNHILYNSGVIKNLFHSLEELPVRMISLGGSKNNISVLINTDYKLKALQKINNGVFGM